MPPKLYTAPAPQNPDSPQFIKDWVRWGAGPRASQFLILAAKTRSVLDGRFTPNKDDVKSVLNPILRHRVITNFSAEAEGVSSVEIVKKLIETV
jgi:MoxR-like ATPase